MNIRTRQDDLIRLLRRRGSTTIDSLAESLQVSRRTLLRDIAELREQGFVIHTSSGPGGGLSLDPTSVLVSPKLTSAEVFALLISIAVLKQTHSLPFSQLADTGLKKIEQSLPRNRVLELRNILESVYIGPAATEDVLATVQSIHRTVLPAFETGFLNSQRMHLSYTDRHGKKTERFVDPHAMLVLSPVWYLIGYDPDKSDFRHFRMDRIRKASTLKDHFQRRPFTIKEGECPFSFFRLDD